MTINYDIKNYPKFEKEFEKLKKQCTSLEKDFERLCKVIQVDLTKKNHRLTQRRYKQIPNLGKNVKFPVFKVKKFRCENIKKGNHSPFRFIFILDRKHKIIYFTECYHKNKKDNQNNARIQEICMNYEYYFDL